MSTQVTIIRNILQNGSKATCSNFDFNTPINSQKNYRNKISWKKGGCRLKKNVNITRRRYRGGITQKVMGNIVIWLFEGSKKKTPDSHIFYDQKKIWACLVDHLVRLRVEPLSV